jgi:hypothetical protein
LLRILARLEPSAWATRADAARKLANRYDWEDIAALYESAYEGALRSSRR